MSVQKRTELQQEVVQALIESRAVDFEAAGAVLSKYGSRAALEGSGLVFKVNHRFIPDWCIPVDFGQIEQLEVERN
jgi:hypothetical protein